MATSPVLSKVSASKAPTAISYPVLESSLQNCAPWSLLNRLIRQFSVRRLCFLFAILLFILLSDHARAISAEAHNQDPDQDQAINESGHLILRSDLSPQREALTMKTHASFEITGMTARVEVTQVFRNDSNEWVEGIYRFPLPQSAAVDHLKMIIGERIIEGEIQPKAKAKEVYRKAKQAGKKASLVEQLRPNMFTSQVANIGPQETIKIIIGYQQAVRYQADEGFSLRFPLAITPRYTPLRYASEDDDEADTASQSPAHNKDRAPDNRAGPQNENSLSPPLQPGVYLQPGMSVVSDNQSPANQFSFDLKLHAGLPLIGVESKGYPAFISQTDETEFTASLTEPNMVANGDLLLQWLPVTGKEPRAAIYSESTSQGHFVSVMVMPPQHSFAEQLEIPKQTIFVIDTSGSMGGESIRQAKTALRSALTRLHSTDSFNIIEFNSGYTQLFSSPQAVTTSNLASAAAFINSLNADGGTEMYSALEAALNQSRTRGTLKQIVFLTDGAISNEADLFKLIQQQLGDTRLFTVGIGSAPNTFFMQRAAEYGRGSYLYVDAADTAGAKIESLFKKIASPQLTHIQIEWPEKSGDGNKIANVQTEMWPSRIPDLYAGEPLWLTAKVPDLSGELILSGETLNTRWQRRLSLSQTTQQKGIATLWAREKIGSVLRAASYGRLNDHQEQVVLQTALNFHLVSPLTSLVAVDKTPSRITEKLNSQRVPENLPRGMRANRLAMPSTGLNLHQQFMLGIALILFALLWLRIEKRRTITQIVTDMGDME